jgi:hypothetical protein
MKKYLVLSLIFVPMVSFGAPSVRMLGNQPALSAAMNSGAKVTPVKSSNENTGVASTARVGSLQAKVKSGNLTSVGTASSSSRFPVIQPAYSYNTVAAPQTGGSSSPAQVPANVDVAAIIDAVTQNIENNYYDINHVYNNNEFVTAVQKEVEDFDDPRVDAIRIRTAQEGSPSGYWEAKINQGKARELPSDYVYIWVEEN